MKLKHIAIIGSLFPILFSLVLFFGVLISADSDDENSNFSSGITGMNLSAEVLKHQPMVEKYAREYGISEYVNVLLAMWDMWQEKEKNTLLILQRASPVRNRVERK